MARVTDRCRNVLMSGEGLRPVLRFSRNNVCEVVRIDTSVERVGWYLVTFYWPDKSAECTVHFADWRVALQWVLDRTNRNGTMACVHRVNIQMGDKLNYLAWQHTARAELQKRGVQIVCPFDLKLLENTGNA